MNLMNAQEGKEYIISYIDTDDEELNAVAGVFESMLEDVAFVQDEQ